MNRHEHAPRPRPGFFFFALLLIPTLPLGLPTPLNGQTDPVRVEPIECRSDNGDRDRYCEEREYRLDARSRLMVDAGPNGGIAVTGWERDEIRLIARVRTSSRRGDAAALAEQVRIRTGSTIEAEGPEPWGRNASYSVSFELAVPHATALRLEASNGGIDLMGLTGEVEARTTNGGIDLVGGGGSVRGRTTNGSLHIELTGDRWDGPGVDLQTTNGGVEIVVPEDYGIELETGTVNGGMQLDVPVLVQGRIDRRLRTELAGGGPLIRALTTNGGVVLRR